MNHFYNGIPIRNYIMPDLNCGDRKANCKADVLAKYGFTSMIAAENSKVSENVKAEIAKCVELFGCGRASSMSRSRKGSIKMGSVSRHGGVRKSRARKYRSSKRSRKHRR
jgi:hypothetical protein